MLKYETPTLGKLIVLKFMKKEEEKKTGAYYLIGCHSHTHLIISLNRPRILASMFDLRHNVYLISGAITDQDFVIFKFTARDYC